MYTVLTPDDVGARIGGLGKESAQENPLADNAALDLLAAKLSEIGANQICPNLALQEEKGRYPEDPHLPPPPERVKASAVTGRGVRGEGEFTLSKIWGFRYAAEWLSLRLRPLIGRTLKGIVGRGFGVVDCFKFRNKIGLDVALEALRAGWRERRFTMDQLWRCAAICRMTNVMRPYLESLV